MTVERACVQAHAKPWGVFDLRPWSRLGSAQTDGDDRTVTAIGEIWFERPEGAGQRSALLLKLLFTRQSLSIQVHPDDAYARSLGQPNGKTEAWYILSATPQARVALGLCKTRTPSQMRAAVADGSLAQLVAWQAVNEGEAIFVPAGTIHAVGAGLVIAEIQQRSDTTFRLSDEGRGRELHVEHGLAVATLGPAPARSPPRRLCDVRSVLVSCPFFVLERILLAPSSTCRLNVGSETWLFVLSGDGLADPHWLRRGDAVFAEADILDIRAGAGGLECLLAYAGGPHPAPNLLECRNSAGSQLRLHPAAARNVHIVNPDRLT